MEASEISAPGISRISPESAIVYVVACKVFAGLFAIRWYNTAVMYAFHLNGAIRIEVKLENQKA